MFRFWQWLLFLATIFTPSTFAAANSEFAEGPGAEPSGTFTLYRNSPLDRNIRIYIATFDSVEGINDEVYNSENCDRAKIAFKDDPGFFNAEFFCEPGYHARHSINTNSIDAQFSCETRKLGLLAPARIPQEMSLGRKRYLELQAMGLSDAEIQAVMAVRPATPPPSVGVPSTQGPAPLLPQPSAPAVPVRDVHGVPGSGAPVLQVRDHRAIADQLLQDAMAKSAKRVPLWVQPRSPEQRIQDAQLVADSFKIQAQRNFDIEPYKWSKWSATNGFDAASNVGKRRLVKQFTDNVIPYVAAQSGHSEEAVLQEFLVARPELGQYMDDRGKVGERADFIQSLRDQGQEITAEEEAQYLRTGKFPK